jgi:hypothetical protein
MSCVTKNTTLTKKKHKNLQGVKSQTLPLEKQKPTTFAVTKQKQLFPFLRFVGRRNKTASINFANSR